MAFVRKTPSGKFELRVRSKLLPRDAYFTFDTESAAHDYGRQLGELLAAGVVPAGLLPEETQRLETVARIVSAWRGTGRQSAADDEVLDHVLPHLGALRLDQLTYAWVEQWVRSLKLSANLAPGTIRKRVGALSRAIDWFLRRHPDVQASNALRLLPRGYATYSAADADALSGDRRVKRDVQRDRRLLPGELERIMTALAGVKRPDRERPLPADADLRDLLLLILHTGLRLREAYTIRRGQVGPRVLRVRSSKQRHGEVAWRDVPLVATAREMLAERARGLSPDDAVFPAFWDGSVDEPTLARVTSRLSRRFGTLFAYAGCDGLTEHDLRHEATCRWFEMRGPDGGWVFRAEEIARIMGWAPGSAMVARYSSFRADDLAARLDWAAAAEPGRRRA